MKKRMVFLSLILMIGFVGVATAAPYMKRDVTKIQAGMTTEEVRSILGRPDHINRDVFRGVETQQWVYREGRYQDLYIYFKDGIYTGSYSRVGEKPSRLP